MATGVLSFTYDVAGYGTEIAQATVLNSGVARRVVTATRAASASQHCVGSARRIIDVHRRCHGYSTSYGAAYYGINIGYSNVVTLCDLILSNAEKLDFDEFDFVANERILYDGTRSIQSGTSDGYAGKFRCATQDYNEIKTLRAMIGQSYTLRIWGVPYRNVYIWPPLRVREVKKKLNLWIYEIELRQDTAMVQRTE